MINSPTASSEWSISPPLAQIRSHRLIDLSGLVHNLNVVTVGVEYPGCVIVRMILELGRRCSPHPFDMLADEFVVGDTVSALWEFCQAVHSSVVFDFVAKKIDNHCGSPSK